MSKIRTLSLLFLTALSLAGSAGCAAPEDEEATSGDQGELNNGYYAPTAVYSMSLEIGNTRCTAVRISELLIATAAHCVLDGSGSFVYDLAPRFDGKTSILAVPGPILNRNFGRPLFVANNWVDPQFSDAQAQHPGSPVAYDSSLSLDLAVIQLKANPFSVAEWPIAPLGTVAPGYSVDITGCGRNSNAPGIGMCGSLTAPVTMKTETDIAFGPNARRDTNRFYWQQTSAIGTDHGDSGGGIFQGGKLVGLVSGAIAAPSLFANVPPINYGFATRMAAQPKLSAAVRANSIQPLL